MDKLERAVSAESWKAPQDMGNSNAGRTPSPRLYSKAFLTHVGEYLDQRHVQFLNAIVNYLEVGRWVRARGFAKFERYRTREQLHTAIAAPIAHERVLYLEFGVYNGASLRHWCGLLKNPGATLQGFDSFCGLPEDWDGLRPAGTFDLKGCLPQFDDERVTLHPGWFDETLKDYVLEDHERLVIHLDADLYSSTERVLRTLHPNIVSGTIIIFDEFCDRSHELRAFEEYLRRTAQRFSILGATSNLEQVAFQRQA